MNCPCMFCKKAICCAMFNTNIVDLFCKGCKSYQCYRSRDIDQFDLLECHIRTEYNHKIFSITAKCDEAEIYSYSGATTAFVAALTDSDILNKISPCWFENKLKALLAFV